MSQSRAEALQNQNETVVTFTLVELLTSLVFIAMILAVVLKDEALQKLDPGRENVRRLQKELEQSRAQLAQAELRVKALEAEIVAQQDLIRRLMQEADRPLPPNAMVVIDGDYWNRVQNAVAISKEQQAELERLQKLIAALKGGASVVRPSCATNPGYLLRIQFNGDGTVTPIRNWPDMSSADVAKIDGIEALSGGGRMSRPAFSSAAGRVDRWARSQPVACAFRVSVSESHGNLSLYKQQLATVEQYFYVSRR